MKQVMPETSWENIGQADIGVLEGLLSLIDKIPDELLLMDSRTYSNFVSAVSTIRVQITMWTSNGTLFVKGMAPDFIRNQRGRPLAVVQDSLAKCPDEAPLATTSELNFIADDGFRQTLRIDIGAIDMALANGEWKAATVLAGSVIEALLLWALQTKREQPDIESAVAAAKLRPRGPLEHWDLHDYIRAARQLEIITEQTAAAADLAKDFRNLIHPGRAQRLRQKCDRASALSAVAGIEHVIRDLTM